MTLPLSMIEIVIALVMTLITLGIILKVRNNMQWSQISNYIEKYKFPAQVIKKWTAEYPKMTPTQQEYGEKALKQFFMIYAKSNHLNKISPAFDMPSKVVDSLWHQFILASRDYHNFCETAFGQYFHHKQHDEPQHTDLIEKTLSSGLINTFRATKSLDKATWVVGALPLVFAMDAMMNIQGGFQYDETNIEAQLKASKVSDSSGSSCGSYAGFSDGGSDSDSGSSSCGGGCGGD
jgi:hypothetical protein